MSNSTVSQWWVENVIIKRAGSIMIECIIRYKNHLDNPLYLVEIKGTCKVTTHHDIVDIILSI